MSAVETISEVQCFGGTQGVYRHTSRTLDCEMQFSVFVPPQAATRRVPVLYYLSGLTCTEENFTVKAGAQRYAAESGLLLIAPDTSPRGLDLPGEHDDWDFGSGAGFYLDATQAPWAAHYRMHDYVISELPDLCVDAFPFDPERAGITGHSMGGHGALTLAFAYPDRFRSLSAFAPIGSPMACPWGEKAFGRYLGPDRETWRRWDASELVGGSGWESPILIDQGDADPFLEEQLKPQRFEAACRAAGVPLELRMQPGYDHSYFFIASFIGEHIRHHAALLA
jgi:S-formylglutathione hydrolase